jgi:heat shock protein HslJ
MMRPLAGFAFAASTALSLATGDPAPAALEGTRWNLVAVAGADAQPGARILLERKKSKRQLSGSTGCGLFGGSYDVFAGRLRITPGEPRKAACSDALRLQETAFLAAQRQTADYRIADDGLTLLSADGHPLARFTRSVP